MSLEALTSLLNGEQGDDVQDPDVLVHALNERFAERGLAYPVPYGDDTDPPRAAALTVDDARLEIELGKAVRRLLRESAFIEPDELADFVARELRRTGLEDAAILVIDYEQGVLIPFVPHGDVVPMDVDGTMAGRAFQTERPMTAERDDGGWNIWLPLLDGAERLGVLQLRAPFLSDRLVERAEEIASAVAELLVSKTQYGDNLVLTRRRQTMTLSGELRWPLLPPLTFASERVGIACVLEPTYDVAGDAFDYAINEGCLHFAIFDAMGHGLEATQMADLALGAYRYSRRLRMDLTATYLTMDDVIAAQFGGSRFVTAQLATLDCDRGSLRWLSAGHPYPLVLRGGRRAWELKTEPCLPLGLGFEPAPETEISLEPGDRLLFFTDGIVEARSPGGERFGQERLIDLTIRALADQQTLAETVRRLVRSVRLHRDGPLQDDATLLFVTWDPQ